MVVAGAADVAVQGQFFLGSSVVLGRQPVQALLEDRGHALVAGRADRQGPLAGLLQALPVIAPSQVEQPQAGAVAVLGVRTVLQLLLDHLGGTGPDVGGPVQEAPR